MNGLLILAKQLKNNQVMESLALCFGVCDQDDSVIAQLDHFLLAINPSQLRCLTINGTRFCLAVFC